MIYQLTTIDTNSNKVLFEFVGSRPTMADKILRRSSYGYEQTENQKGMINNRYTVYHLV